MTIEEINNYIAFLRKTVDHIAEKPDSPKTLSAISQGLQTIVLLEKELPALYVERDREELVHAEQDYRHLIEEHKKRRVRLDAAVGLPGTVHYPMGMNYKMVVNDWEKQDLIGPTFEELNVKINQCGNTIDSLRKKLGLPEFQP